MKCAIAVALEDAEAWQERYDSLSIEEWDLPSTHEEDLCDARAYFALPRDWWLVPIAPDEWHRYDISGCGAYEIAIPNLAADARLQPARPRTPFVFSLPLCFRGAASPTWERLRVPHPPSPRSRHSLTISCHSNASHRLLAISAPL